MTPDGLVPPADYHAIFMQDIRDAPADDLPRLIYADWLDDNGDSPRADFIRVQCRLARSRADDPVYPLLQKQEEELLAEQRPGLAKAACPLVTLRLILPSRLHRPLRRPRVRLLPRSSRRLLPTGSFAEHCPSRNQGQSGQPDSHQPPHRCHSQSGLPGTVRTHHQPHRQPDNGKGYSPDRTWNRRNTFRPG